MLSLSSHHEWKPPRPKKQSTTLRSHQLRVLREIGKADGPITRGEIARRLGITPVATSRALGFDDPIKRSNFEKNAKEGGFPSLITLGYIRRYELDIEGVLEIGYEINSKGREALKDNERVELPPPRNSYANKEED